MRLFIFTSIISLLSLSCTKEDKELTIIEQEKNIDSYITSTYPNSTIIRNNGANKIIIKAGISTTDALEFGDSLSFHYAGYIFETAPSAMFATNRKEVADSLSFDLSDPNYDLIKILFKEDIYISGLTNGLLGVREDEHSVILFSAKHGFEDQSVYNIPNLSALKYEVWIKKITKNN